MSASAPLRVLAAEHGNRLGPDREGAPVVNVPLQHLRFHPRNIRSNLGDLTALTESIRQEGILVPLMAERIASGGLRLLHGHRRWAAADMAGLRRAPVVIVPAHADDDAILLMLAENTGRAAVDTRDLQRSVHTLRVEFRWSVAAIAARLGVAEDVVESWGSGRARALPSPGAAAPRRATPVRTGPPRPPTPKVGPKVVHQLLAQHAAGAVDDAAVVAQLRALLGDWKPAVKPEASPPPCSEPDWAAVEALVTGRLPARAVRPVDRRAAVRELTSRGHAAAAIAERTGMSERTVERLRAAS
ncbi:MAG: ParB N-terminal domain-containing protein [Pseudonocardia sp.]|nr:ParB N-terminal domain-containing protein [Pseudonocardia sp.]